jgi:hypothetical protein
MVATLSASGSGVSTALKRKPVASRRTIAAVFMDSMVDDDDGGSAGSRPVAN